jgi:hypothetical protein
MIVALWAVPRSVSTALEKSLAQHSHVQAVHEPFTDCYYFSSGRRSTRYGLQPHKQAHGPDDVLAQIAAARSPTTVLKELCFQGEPYVGDSVLAAWTNVFVVRHPARVWTSLRQLKPDFTEDEFGFTALARMWRRVVEGLGQEPRVVEGDRFRSTPDLVLKEICTWIGLDFEPGMTIWPKGPIRPWLPDEAQSQQKWHQKLEDSHSVFGPDRPLPPDWTPDESDPGRISIYRRAVDIYDSIQAHRSGNPGDIGRP